MNAKLHRHADHLALLALAGIAVVIFWPWLFEGKAFYIGDIGLYFLPMTQYLRQGLLQGTLPLWNRYIFCGVPFLGNPQIWPFYPSTLLLYFLPAPTYIMVSSVLHLYLAGASCYLFLRRIYLNLRVWPSLLGATTYMLGGYVVSKTQFPNMLAALSYIPLLLLLTEQMLKKPQARQGLALGVVLGLQILAAHAQITLLTLYLMLIYSLWYWISQQQPTMPVVKAQLLYGLGAVMIAGGLACGQWLPVVQLTHETARQNMTLVEANRFFLFPEELTNFFWAYRFGGPMMGNWSMPGNFWEVACYLGIVPCALAVIAVWSGLARWGKRRKDVLFWTTLFVGSAILALGAGGGLYILAFMLPGINRFHDPARLLLGTAISCPVLVAIGWQEIEERWQSKVQRPLYSFTLASLFLLVATCFDLGSYARAFYPLKPVQEITSIGSHSPFMHMVTADKAIKNGSARILTADPNKNLIWLYDYQSYQQDDAQLLTHWAEVAAKNMGMLQGLLQTTGYEPLSLQSAVRRKDIVEQHLPVAIVKRNDANNLKGNIQDRAVVSTLPQAVPDYASLLGVMGVKYLLVFDTQPLKKTPGLALISTGNWQRKSRRAYLYANQRFSPRACLYPNVQHDNRSLSLFRAELAPQPVSEVQDTFSAVRMSVPASPQPRTLVVDDTLYPGWLTYIDGQPTAMYPTQDAFRAIDIPPAKNSESATQQVTSVYRPTPFVLGVFVSLLTLSGLAAFGVNNLFTAQNRCL